jgi:predicted ester cyclase
MRSMDGRESLERNRRFVIGHFEDFVNRKDLAAIDRNMSVDFVDHDGPGGKPTDRAGDRAMMEAMFRIFPDLHVEVRESLAEGDKVMVRNLWTGTRSETNERMEFHGFVLWRIVDGKIVERWATVTPLHELAAATLDW